MPKIDPTTGCEVMTLLEFCAEEGEAKGQTAGEYLGDVFEDMANEAAEAADRWMKPEMFPEVLKEIRRIVTLELKEWKSTRWYGREEGKGDEYMGDWEAPPIPVEIIKMEDSQGSCNFQSNHAILVGIARCKDGKNRRFNHKYWSFSGSRSEPPEDDWELTWEIC